MGRATASLIFLVIFVFHQIYAGRVPVILIPGNGGNQLEAKIDRPSDWEGDCPKKKDWHRIWLDVWQLLPSKVSCWSKVSTLTHDPATGEAIDSPGVTSRVKGWGTVETMDHLDTSWFLRLLGNSGAYMHPLTRVFRGYGYQDGVDLRGAPYDWRRTPESQNLFPRMRALVEETYNLAGRRVMLLAHSLGGRYTLLFLHSMSQEWKDKYIHSFTPIGAPWGGASLAMLAMASGFNFHQPFVSSRSLRPMQRSCNSNIFLLPTKLAFDTNFTLIKTAEKTFTTDNIEEFIESLGEDHEVMKKRFALVKHMRHDLRDPGVKVHCIYGTGFVTEESFEYRLGDYPDSLPITRYGEGDGIVNLNSLRLCERWANVTVKAFPLLGHQSALYSSRVQDYLLQELYD